MLVLEETVIRIAQKIHIYIQFFYACNYYLPTRLTCTVVNTVGHTFLVQCTFIIHPV